jgi:hypothetical protein
MVLTMGVESRVNDTGHGRRHGVRCSVWRGGVWVLCTCIERLPHGHQADTAGAADGERHERESRRALRRQMDAGVMRRLVAWQTGDAETGRQTD